MLVEVQSWPYSFPASEDFQTADQRGSVTGKLFVSDRYISLCSSPPLQHTRANTYMRIYLLRLITVHFSS